MVKPNPEKFTVCYKGILFEWTTKHTVNAFHLGSDSAFTCFSVGDARTNDIYASDFIKGVLRWMEDNDYSPDDYMMKKSDWD